LRLENLPHAAGADLFEDRVVAEDQGFDLARRNLLRLKLRQVVLLDEFSNELFDARGMRLGRDKVLELASGNDAAVLKLLDNGFERNGYVPQPPAIGSERGLYPTR